MHYQLIRPVSRQAPVPRQRPLIVTPPRQALLTADFEIGHYIRERVVSRAVLLYTGEGLDEDDDDDYEEEVSCSL